MPLLGVFNDLLFGLGVALTPVNMTIVIVGLVLGTAVGVLPGLGGTNGVALLLPLTFPRSFSGAVVAIILFPFFAPPLAELALRFGPPENFAVLFLAFATFAGLGGGSPTKTILMTLLGLLLRTVGFDII